MFADAQERWRQHLSSCAICYNAAGDDESGLCNKGREIWAEIAAAQAPPGSILSGPGAERSSHAVLLSSPGAHAAIVIVLYPCKHEGGLGYDVDFAVTAAGAPMPRRTSAHFLRFVADDIERAGYDATIAPKGAPQA